MKNRANVWFCTLYSTNERIQSAPDRRLSFKNIENRSKSTVHVYSTQLYITHVQGTEYLLRASTHAPSPSLFQCEWGITQPDRANQTYVLHCPPHTSRNNNATTCAGTQAAHGYGDIDTSARAEHTGAGHCGVILKQMITFPFAHSITHPLDSR